MIGDFNSNPSSTIYNIINGKKPAIEQLTHLEVFVKDEFYINKKEGVNLNAEEVIK